MNILGWSKNFCKKIIWAAQCLCDPISHVVALATSNQTGVEFNEHFRVVAPGHNLRPTARTRG